VEVPDLEKRRAENGDQRCQNDVARHRVARQIDRHRRERSRVGRERYRAPVDEHQRHDDHARIKRDAHAGHPQVVAPAYPADEDPLLTDPDEQADQDPGSDSSHRMGKRRSALDLVDQEPNDRTDLGADQHEARRRPHPLGDDGSQGTARERPR